ncbi:MAG: methyltransferase domain-containing protein [Pirellulales bacterium]|nr:methyltransferase domain-containing protein [Pirellulales bacterium]
MEISEELIRLLQCPLCGSSVEEISPGDLLCCSKATCENGRPDGFPHTNGKMILVDFQNSVLDLETILKSGGASQIKRSSKKTLRNSFLSLLVGKNKVAAPNARKLLDKIKAREEKPKILIIGGATIGSGSDMLFEDPNVQTVSFDIYSTENTDFIADGHSIPIKDATIDAVWVQAVLEHVLNPWRVVSEIARVLKPTGLVYSEIPFMQQVHEGAYDFTRFSESGQRWLFRHFRCIESGVAQGPGSAAFLSLQRLVACLLRQPRYGSWIGIALFFWLRFLDRFIPREFGLGSASGIYYFGEKTDRPLSPKDIITQYQGVPD